MPMTTRRICKLPLAPRLCGSELPPPVYPTYEQVLAEGLKLTDGGYGYEICRPDEFLDSPEGQELVRRAEADGFVVTVEYLLQDREMLDEFVVLRPRQQRV